MDVLAEVAASASPSSVPSEHPPQQTIDVVSHSAQQSSTRQPRQEEEEEHGPSPLPAAVLHLMHASFSQHPTMLPVAIACRSVLSSVDASADPAVATTCAALLQSLVKLAHDADIHATFATSYADLLPHDLRSAIAALSARKQRPKRVRFPPDALSTHPFNIDMRQDPKLSIDQLDNDINQFIARKRAAIDLSNQKEFLASSTLGSARTKPNENLDRGVQMKLDVIHNKDGPLARSIADRNQSTTETDALKNADAAMNKNHGLITRIKDVEEHLDMKPSSANADLHVRIKAIENRLLKVEKEAPLYAAHYFNSLRGKIAKPELPPPNIPPPVSVVPQMPAPSSSSSSKPKSTPKFTITLPAVAPQLPRKIKTLRAADPKADEIKSTEAKIQDLKEKLKAHVPLNAPPDPSLGSSTVTSSIVTTTASTIEPSPMDEST